MLRKCKGLGIAILVVFAMGAVIASTASAQGKITSDGPVTLVTDQTGGTGANRLTAFDHVIECNFIEHTGHKLNSTSAPKELIPSGSTTSTFTPHYSGCAASILGTAKPVTVKMTSCDYGVTIGFTTSGGWGLTTHIKCNTLGDKIHVEIYNNAAHTELLCSITIGEQTVSGAHVFNTTGGHLGIQGTFTSISATRSGVCILDKTGTSTTSATLSTDFTVSGWDAENEKTSIAIS